MGGDGARSAGVTLLLAGLALVSTVAVPAGATSCVVDKGSHLERGDGSWVVSDGASYERHDSGRPWDDSEGGSAWSTGTGDHPGLEAAPDAFARGPRGEWWVFVDHQFVSLGENLSVAGKQRYDTEGVFTVEDIANVDGQWWALGDRTLIAYSESFSTVRTFSIRGDTTGMTAANGSLWTVRGDGTVTRFAVGSGRPVAATTHRGVIGRAVRNPEDLHRAPDGDWWVLSEGGGIAEYTPAWEHTGFEYGDVHDEMACGTRGSNLPEALGLYLLVATVGVATTARRHGAVRTALARAGLGVASFGIAFLVYDYRVPELFSGIHRLPDAAVSAPLVGLAVLLSVGPSLWGDRTVADVLAALVLTSPLVVVAVIY
jgi:hypothetical protein